MADALLAEQRGGVLPPDAHARRPRRLLIIESYGVLSEKMGVPRRSKTGRRLG